MKTKKEKSEAKAVKLSKEARSLELEIKLCVKEFNLFYKQKQLFLAGDRARGFSSLQFKLLNKCQKIEDLGFGSPFDKFTRGVCLGWEPKDRSDYELLENKN